MSSGVGVVGAGGAFPAPQVGVRRAAEPSSFQPSTPRKPAQAETLRLPDVLAFDVADINQRLAKLAARGKLDITA